MRILLIDDSEYKRGRVVDFLLGTFGGSSVEIREADSYESALRALAETYYDLVLLDLLLPAAGGDPSPETSQAIIREVLRGTASIPPMHIIGLTAYENVALDQKAFYEANLFALILYSDDDDDWSRLLLSKLMYLVRSKDAAAAFQANNYGVDLVVIAARYENEFLPVRRRLFSSIDAEAYPQWDGRIAIGNVNLPGVRSLRTVLCCVDEMGMAPSAAVASQAISVFRPRLLSMLGMCCGFRVEESASPRKLMDAIIVREVNCWEEGKYDAAAASGFRNRARARFIEGVVLSEVDRAAEAAAATFGPMLSRLSKTKDYQKIIGHFGNDNVRCVPDVALSPFVSGSSVMADREKILEILDRHPKALGLDMEMYGVYTAAAKASGRRPHVVGVKGVADFGEVDKDDLAQRAASDISARVLKCLMAQLSIW